MYTQHLLPTFFDGIPLGALDVNQIAQEQQFVASRDNSLNFAQELIEGKTTRYLFHRFRWLRWRVSNISQADLIINGFNVGKVAATTTSGFLDLGGGWDSFYSNPFGITLHRPYTIKWDGPSSTYPDGWETYEHPAVDGIFTLPFQVPTFTSGANSAQLNALSGDMEYLVNQAALMPQSAFTCRNYGVDGTRRIKFRMYHKNRYLHCRFEWTPQAEGVNNQFDVYIEGQRIYTDGAPGSVTYNFLFRYDLAGTNHEKFANDRGYFFNIDYSTLSGWYEIEVRADNPEQWAQGAHLKIWMIGESPYTARLS